MALRAVRAVVAGLGVASLAAALSAQRPDPAQTPTFRTKVELIRIDAVVVDADGRSIRGLTKDDFQILDRGQPRAVATFEEISHERPPAPVLPPTLKLDVADNSTARSDRLIVLILDDLHFRDKSENVKDMARKVINELGLQASLALVTTSGRFGVEPTEDRSLLLAELDRFIDSFDPEGKRTRPTPALALPQLPPSPAGIPRAEPADLARFFGDMSQYRTLQDVARKIGADDGRRKAFVWISGGNSGRVAAPTLDNGAVDFHLMGLAGLLEALRKSNVAAYPIATGDFSSRLLHKVAEESGGFVTDSPDFEAGLERLIEDLDHYYLLGFYPPAGTDRSYHALAVTVNRPGATVRHRRGYQVDATPKPPKNDHALAGLAANVLPAVDLPLRLSATPLPPNGTAPAAMAVFLEVRASRAVLEEADGTWRDRLQYAVWAVDLDKKKPKKTMIRESRFTMKPLDLESQRLDTVTYQLHTALVLSPGRYQLRASASSAKLKVGGSVYLEATMPDFKKAQIELGSVMLRRADEDPKREMPVVSSILAKGRLPFTPLLEREFPKETVLRIWCEVARPARTGAEITVSLLDATDNVVRTLDVRSVPALQPASVDLTLPLHDLAPGGYVVRVMAAAPNGQRTVVRETGFVVR